MDMSNEINWDEALREASTAADLREKETEQLEELLHQSRIVAPLGSAWLNDWHDGLSAQERALLDAWLAAAVAKFAQLAEALKEIVNNVLAAAMRNIHDIFAELGQALLPVPSFEAVAINKYDPHNARALWRQPARQKRPSRFVRYNQIAHTTRPRNGRRGRR